LTAALLLGAIRGYKILLSPLFAGSCRFFPSCADYAAEAVRRHGAWRGSVLAGKRLLRCRPLGGAGFDPVPEELAWAGEGSDEETTGGCER